MAKSVRSSGDKGETHYNSKKKTVSSGRTAGKKSYGDERSEGSSEEGGESRPYARKPVSDRPYSEKRSSDSRERPADGKPFARKPYGDKKPSNGEGRSRPGAGSSSDRKPFRRDGDKPFERRSEDTRPDRGDSRDSKKPYGDKKPFRADRDSSAEKRPYSDKKPFSSDRDNSEKRPYGDKKPFRVDRDSSGEKRPYGDKKPYSANREGSGEKRPYGEKKPFRADRENSGEKRPYADKKPFRRDGDRPSNEDRGEKRPYSDRPSPRPRDTDSENAPKRSYVKREEGPDGEKRPRKPLSKGDDRKGPSDRPFKSDRKSGGDKPFSRRPAGDKKPFGKRDSYGKPLMPKKHFDGNEFVENTNPDRPGKWDTEAKNGPMTLNKYIAHSGVSSRRDAAIMIKDGKVSVNGEVLREPGYRVQAEDKITMDGQVMTPQRNFVYVLLNKPKDFLTTTEDDRGRRTVMELINGATDDRLYPIGRLDRNTTGVLLLTNDGDLAQRLSHPKFESKKIYQVTLDKDVTKKDFDKIVEGVELEDGMAKVDRLAYLEKKNEIGLEIHSGRNRIVRRIFESLGYEVERLDRVMYAGLTKKNVSRGKWRFLTEKEVINLKHFKN